MIPRSLAALAVVGAGAALGSWAARRAVGAEDAGAPTRHEAAGSSRTLRHRVEHALAAGRQAAATREAQLREEFGATASTARDAAAVPIATAPPASVDATTGTNRPAQPTG